jgi:DNA polymerase-3 subunit epsilon
VAGAESGYDATVQAATAALQHDPSPVVAALTDAIQQHVDKLDFERAAQLRDGISALVDGSMRAQRLSALRGVRLVAVKRSGHGFDVVCIVDGVLAGSAHVSQGVWAACARLKDEWDEAPADALVEEREMIARWLESDGTRLVFIEGEWSSPAMGAARHAHWVAARNLDRESVEQLRR